VPFRDLRLDVFRGLALLVLVIDHAEEISGVQLVSFFTYAPVGVSTAAELFIFLSGLVFGLTYESVLRTHGYVRLHTRCLVRAWQIYLLHVACLVFTIGAVTALAAWMDAGDATTIFPHHGLVVSNEMLTGFLQLRSNPQYFDILPLYVVLLLFVPFLFPLLHKWPWAGLGVSATGYGVAQLAAAQGHADALPFAASMYYSPLAWQLLFVVGIAAGFRAARGEPLPRLHGRHLVAAVTVLVVVALWYKGVRINAILGWFGDAQYVKGQGIPYDVPFIDKSTLGAFRLVHFLLLATLVAQFAPRADAGFWQSGVCRPMALCGRQGLEMFVVGVTLTYSIGTIMRVVGGGRGLMLLLDIAGILTLLACAHVVSWRKREPWRRPVLEPNAAPAPIRFEAGAQSFAERRRSARPPHVV
jgi:hypothetical protein